MHTHHPLIDLVAGTIGGFFAAVAVHCHARAGVRCHELVVVRIVAGAWCRGGSGEGRHSLQSLRSQSGEAIGGGVTFDIVVDPCGTGQPPRRFASFRSIKVFAQTVLFPTQSSSPCFTFALG